MTGQVSIPIVGRVDKRSLLVGAGLLLAALVIPKVRDVTRPVVDKIAGTIGGK
jgi:hypothetical protein